MINDKELLGWVGEFCRYAGGMMGLQEFFDRGGLSLGAALSAGILRMDGREVSGVIFEPGDYIIRREVMGREIRTDRSFDSLDFIDCAFSSCKFMGIMVWGLRGVEFSNCEMRVSNGGRTDATIEVCDFDRMILRVDGGLNLKGERRRAAYWKHWRCRLEIIR